MGRRFLLVALVVLAAAWYLLLPPAATRVPVDAAQVPIRGVIHIHTNRSDGTGTPETIAAAAARAGLRFIVLTDHGDATRRPDPPVYRSGVLCIDAVEISTGNGHLVALGLPQAPYPLGGESRDVVEDVHRLGGIAIAAHPASAKPELRWTDWAPPIDGLEWLNGDSEWRDEGVPTLLRVLFTYPGRQAETLATLLDRPEALLRTWEQLTARRPVVAIAAADAHAHIGLRNLGEPYDNNAAALHLPSYEALFRTFSIAVSDVVLSGVADDDADAVLDAISGGRVFSTIDAVASPGVLSFSATSGVHRASMGGRLMLDGPVRFQVAAQGPAGGEIVLLRDGARVAAGPVGTALTQEGSSDPAVYRVEVHVPGAPGQPPVPWLFSNPIYVGRAPGDDHVGIRPAAVQSVVQYADGPADEWAVETGAQSRGARDRLPAVAGGDQVGFRFGLGGAMADSPYAALVMPAGAALALYDRLTFTARASRPMRVSVQLRAEQDGTEQRWHRSVYMDDTPRTITVFFEDMTPRGRTAQPRPDLPRVKSVLFVVDSVNADTGTNGQFTIDDVNYER